MLDMSVLSFLAHTYFVLAIGYNVVSQVWGDVFGRKFSATDPSFGVLIISVIYTIYLLDGVISVPARIFMLAVFVALIARFGVVKHLGAVEAEAYLSPLTRTVAIGINVFGVVVLSAHVIGGIV